MKKNKWEKENLKKIVDSSKSQGEVFNKMGLRKAGSNNRTLRKYLKLYGISTEHFDKNWKKISEISSNRKLDLSEILKVDSNYSRSNLKERLYTEGVKKRECEICGQNEIWRGKRMSLILDHINGIYNDNRLENLRIVCPNCNATFPTHCGKNIKNLKKFKKIESVIHLKELMKTQTKKEIFEDYEKTNITEKWINDIKKLNKLKSSNIDFSKFGWVTKAAKIIGVKDQVVNRWMKRMDPDFYKECFVRN
jgi:hypothetical protein